MLQLKVGRVSVSLGIGITRMDEGWRWRQVHLISTRMAVVGVLMITKELPLGSVAGWVCP